MYQSVDLKFEMFFCKIPLHFPLDNLENISEDQKIDKLYNFQPPKIINFLQGELTIQGFSHLLFAFI
jgi:hypothetical protein